MCFKLHRTFQHEIKKKHFFVEIILQCFPLGKNMEMHIYQIINCKVIFLLSFKQYFKLIYLLVCFTKSCHNVYFSFFYTLIFLIMYILSPLLFFILKDVFPLNLQILLSLSFSFPFVSIYLSPLSFMGIYFFSSVRPPNITFFLISFFHLKPFLIYKISVLESYINFPFSCEWLISFFYFILSSSFTLFAHIPPPILCSLNQFSCILATLSSSSPLS